jgi:hypothetical protein
LKDLNAFGQLSQLQLKKKKIKNQQMDVCFSNEKSPRPYYFIPFDLDTLFKDCLMVILNGQHLSSSYKIKQQSTGLPQTNWTYILMQTWQETTTTNKFNKFRYKFRRLEKLESTISTKSSTNISQEAEEETDLDVKLPASPKQSNGRSKGKKALSATTKDTN